MSASVPVHHRPVFLNVVQNNTVHVSFYIAGGRVDGSLYLTDHGYWQARLNRYQTLDDDRDCLVHSTVEHITDKEREPVAAWIAHQIDTALQTPRLTPAERRMVEYVNANLESMFRFPGMWGGPEATELQALQAMEFRDAILHPKNDLRDILDRYATFLRTHLPSRSSNAAYFTLAQLHPGEDEYAQTCRVAELMSRFNQVLLGSDR